MTQNITSNHSKCGVQNGSEDASFRYTIGNKFALNKLQKSRRRNKLLHIQGSQGKNMFKGNFFSLNIHIQARYIYMHFKTVFRNMV